MKLTLNGALDLSRAINSQLSGIKEVMISLTNLL